LRDVRNSPGQQGSGGYIAVLTDFFEPAVRAGGPVRSLAALTKSGIGSRVKVLTRDRDVGEKVPMSGVVPDVWVSHGNGEVMYFGGAGIPGVWRAWRTLWKFDPSHIYINSLFAVATGMVPLALAKLGLLPKARIVLAPRGQLDPGALSLRANKKQVALRILLGSGMLRSVRWHATSELEARHIRRVVGAAAEVCVALPLPTVPGPPAVHQRPSRPLRLIFISRISPKKGLHTLLEALKYVVAPVHLDVYGPSDDEGYGAKCHALAGALPEHHRVEFHGVVSHDRVNTLLRVSDAFVLPTHGENFGHAIYEALAASCPVVLTPTTPWTAAVAAGAGWLVEPDDVSGLAVLLEGLAVGSPEDFEARSASALACALAYYAEAEAENGWRRLFA